MLNQELYDVIDYKLLEGYTIWLKFDDETERVIDFEPILLGPLFGPLRNHELFRQVELDQELGTLVWPTGADIDPTVLHDWPHHVDAIVQRRRQQFAVAV